MDSKYLGKRNYEVGSVNGIAVIVLGAGAMLFSVNTLSQSDAEPESRPHFYLSGKYGGYQARNGEFYGGSDLFEIAAGFSLNPFFGVEASYTYFSEFGVILASAEIEGFGLAGMASLPIAPATTVHAKLGQLWSDAIVIINGAYGHFSDTHLFYGIGIRFAAMDPLVVSIEYDRYEIDLNGSNSSLPTNDLGTNVDTMKLGIHLPF